MCCSIWLNRGTALGLLLGLIIGGGSTAAWYMHREQPKEEPNAEPQPAPLPVVAPAPDPTPTRGITKAERAEQIRKLEQLADSLRMDIASMEKQIELLAKANGLILNGADVTRLGLLQKRYSEADAEMTKVNREIDKLTADLTLIKIKIRFLKEPQTDPALEQQSAQLKGAIEVKKQEREKIRREHDTLQQLIATGVSGGLNIPAVREGLQPQRDQLDKVNTLLAQLRVQQQLEP